MRQCRAAGSRTSPAAVELCASSRSPVSPTSRSGRRTWRSSSSRASPAPSSRRPPSSSPQYGRPLRNRRREVRVSRSSSRSQRVTLLYQSLGSGFKTMFSGVTMGWLLRLVTGAPLMAHFRSLYCAYECYFQLYFILNQRGGALT